MNYFNLKWNLSHPKNKFYRYTAIYIEDEDLPYEEAIPFAIKIAKYLQYNKRAENIYGTKAYFENEFNKMYSKLGCSTYEEFEKELASKCRQAECSLQLPLLMYVKDAEGKKVYWEHYGKEKIKELLNQAHITEEEFKPYE